MRPVKREHGFTTPSDAKRIDFVFEGVYHNGCKYRYQITNTYMAKAFMQLLGREVREERIAVRRDARKRARAMSKLVKLYMVDENGKPKLAETVQEWSDWHSVIENRRVAFDQITDHIHVSTVFLGIDHNYSMQGDPVLWETMIFGGPHNLYQERYTSLEDAIAGHEIAVAMATEDSDKQVDDGEDKNDETHDGL